ncbi:MAG: SPASM domain-containing protein [Eubacterium sp.]|nr:SPASM domain-containing protein [Eubacterium sp.]
MAISVMLKPASSNCNLKCEYCFYHSLAAERQEFSKGMMCLDTAKQVIDSAFDFAKGTDVYFTFQGGEPLLCGIDFYREFLSYIKDNNCLNAPVHLCLQTNGTLITEEFADFFKRNNFLVGVSLDGNEELNSYRAYPDGSNSFRDVMNGINLLKKYDVSFNVLSVLTKCTARNFRSAYRFFKENDLRYLQFIPCLRPMKSDFDASLYMDNNDYAEFLRRGFNIYFNDYMRGEYVSIRSFDNYIALASGNNAEQCGMNGCCSTQFVVEGDGSVYPCDFYCVDEWYLGNINDSSFDELYRCEKSVQFLKESFKINDECKECKYFYICRAGGCKRNRQDMNYCTAYKAFFEGSEYKMKQMKGR